MHCMEERPGLPPEVSLISYACTENITCVTIRSGLPGGAVDQSVGPNLMVAVLHLLSIQSCRCEVSASWTDVVVTLSMP